MFNQTRRTAFSTVAATAAAVALLAAPARAGYKYEVDRFTGTKTASYRQRKTGCTQTKGIQGRADSCLFINSTESGLYPAVSIFKINPGWELLTTAPRKGDAPAIVTLTNGQVIRTKIPAELDTNTGYGGNVYEHVSLYLGKTDIPAGRIKTLEVQYGSAEFKITPGAQAICALKRAPSC